MSIFVFLSLGALSAVLMLWPQAPKSSPILRASMLWGTLLVGTTEILSLGEWITVTSLASFWVFVFLVCIGIAIRLWQKGNRFYFAWDWRSLDWFERSLLAVIAAMMLVTLFVALKAPAQTWDSLTYHMARVAHWTQNQSVNIYASGIERQNVMGPMAEYAVLHLYILQGGDALANLVNWLAYAGCILASAHVAGLLGASRRGKMLAALASASLPMALAQASSTATDIVVAYWTLCLAAEILAALAKPAKDWADFVYMGMAAGLALLTKATAVAFILPLIAWFGLALVFGRDFKRALVSGATVLAMTLIINGPFFGRMTQTYGTPLGPPAIINYHRNELITPGVMVSNTLKNASLHFRTDNETLRLFLLKVFVKTHQWLGLELSDPRISMSEFVIPAPSANEDVMPNPAHLILFGICALVCLNPKAEKKTAFFFVLSAIGAFLLFSIGNKWQPFGVRLQMPFFMLAVPVIGLVLERWPLIIRIAAALSLVFFARIALFSLQERPIIPLAGLTDETSILKASRGDLFGNSAAKQIAQKLQTSRCTQVGIMLQGDDAEYAYWYHLNKPASPFRLEWIVAGTPSAQYQDPGFTPCAVICAACSPDTLPAELTQEMEIDGVFLFIDRQTLP